MTVWPPSAWPRLAHSSLVLIASRVLGAALVFVTSVLVARGLGDAGFGQWTLSMAWASALAMLSDFSLNTLLTREAARAPGQANQLLLGSLVGKLPFLAVVGGGTILFAPDLGWSGEAAGALRLAAVLAGAMIAYGSFTALFRAFDRMAAVFWLDTGGLAAQLLGAAWVLGRGGRAFELVGMAAVVQLALFGLAIAVWWIGLRRQGGAVSVRPARVGQMIGQALPFAAAAILGAIQLRASTLLLGYVRGEAEVGWFGAAWRFSEAAKLIPSGIFAAVFPAFAAGAGQAPGDRLVARYLLVLIGLALGSAAGLIAFARPLIGLTFGPDFAPAAGVLIWLSLGLAPSLLVSGCALYLYATGDEVHATRLEALGTSLLLLASIPLITAFGARGAALGILTSKAIMGPIMLRRVWRRRAAQADSAFRAALEPNVEAG